MRPARYPRPTLRCLTDLGWSKPPPISEPLDTLDHVLIRKARHVTDSAPVVGGDAGASQRVGELDDRVYWKVKVDRWRGALHCVPDEEWLVAAGYRREGDPDDFYAELGSTARRRRAEYNELNSRPLLTETYTEWLLPTELDAKRLRAEDALRIIDDLRAEMSDLTRESAATGREATGEGAGCELGVLVRRTEIGEVYAAVRVVAPTPRGSDVHALILDAMPAVADRDGWFLDRMPERDAQAGELVWSNVIDQDALSALLA